MKKNDITDKVDMTKVDWMLVSESDMKNFDVEIDDMMLHIKKKENSADMLSNSAVMLASFVVVMIIISLLSNLTAINVVATCFFMLAMNVLMLYGLHKLNSSNVKLCEKNVKDYVDLLAKLYPYRSDAAENVDAEKQK